MSVSHRVDRIRLEAVLGDPALSWLLERCRRRLERGRALDVTVTLSGADRTQREAVARLMGRRPGRGASLSVHLPDVERLLVDAGIATDLATAVQALTGPVDDADAAATAHEARWDSVWQEGSVWACARDDAVEGAGGDRQRTMDAGHLAEAPPRHRWLHRLRAEGLLRRLAGGDPEAGRRLLRDAVAVVDRLPAEGRSRSALAATALGDAHALDDEQAVATLVLRAADELAGTLTPADDGPRSRDRRERWASVGVTLDPLTSTVTALGLPGDSDSVTGRCLAALASAGEPATLTLRQLLRSPPDLSCLAGRPVFVCENPSVVAEAADQLGTGIAAPLLCTNGQPSVATGLLLDRLAAAGASLRVHADFDWAGVRIASAVIARTGAWPWRFDADAYIAVAARSRKPLVGAEIRAPWASALVDALRRHQVAVEEELVLDTLLADLS